jgi:hydroxypyruvate reductase
MNLEALREAANEIFRASVQAADPVDAVRRHLAREGERLLAGGEAYRLDAIEHIYLVGGGKASGRMARAVEEILGDRITGGVIMVPYGQLQPTVRVSALEAGHPIPDEAGTRGAAAIHSIVSSATDRDLVIALISGGGSALMPLPIKGIELAAKQDATRQLLACGATIKEINVVRKHLSRIKGGRLAAAAAPGRVLALILSDVVGDRLEAIASGPTVPDSSSFADACEILERYALERTVDPAIVRHLHAGRRGEAEETPKPKDALFDRVKNVLIGNNFLALQAAAERARGLGLSPLILSSSVEGEAREVARVHAALAREVRATGNPLPPPACLITGGETTVTLRGEGVGGRNQEFVLAAALEIDGLQDVVILSAGTDGFDGPTDAAGAVADGTTARRARSLGLEPNRSLRDNDSYRFFQRLNDLVITGPTHTNVMDIRVVLVG